MSHFINDPAVITYAWELVNEYNKHQREQDKLHRSNHRPLKRKRSGMMWFGDKKKEGCSNK
jgi:hypothetical protein